MPETMKPRKRQLKPRAPQADALPPKKPRAAKERSVTGAELAAYLDLTPARISQLTSEGEIPRNDDGSYPIDRARVAYVRFLKKAASVRGKKAEGAEDLDAAKLRKMDLEHAVAIGALIPIEDAVAVITEAFTSVRNDLSNVGSRVTRDMELRRQVDAEIARVIDTARHNLEALADALGKTEAEGIEV